MIGSHTNLVNVVSEYNDFVITVPFLMNINNCNKCVFNSCKEYDNVKIFFLFKSSYSVGYII